MLAGEAQQAGEVQWVVEEVGLTLSVVAAFFVLCYVGSLVAERVPALARRIPREANQRLIERIHGWPDYTGTRYASSGWLLIVAGICVAFFVWGVAPWPGA